MVYDPLLASHGYIPCKSSSWIIQQQSLMLNLTSKNCTCTNIKMYFKMALAETSFLKIVFLVKIWYFLYLLNVYIYVYVYFIHTFEVTHLKLTFVLIYIIYIIYIYLLCIYLLYIFLYLLYIYYIYTSLYIYINNLDTT